MVVLNYSGEEINAKIVYYGPGLSGKTTNLEYIHEKMPVRSKGKLVSMKTRTDRTLFFDFLPLELGEIRGYRTRFLLYTVPGQVYYNATRKLVLKGVDAVVFVADSSRQKLQENMESLRNLEENLNEHGLSLDHLPWVIQYNKRDLSDAMPIAELHEHLNLLGVPAYESIAMQGSGVYDTFQGVAGLLFEQLTNKLEKAGVSPDSGEKPVATDHVSDAVDTALREVPENTAPAGPPPVQEIPAQSIDSALPSASPPAGEPAGQPSASIEPPQPPPPPQPVQESGASTMGSVGPTEGSAKPTEGSAKPTSQTVESLVTSTATAPPARPDNEATRPSVGSRADARIEAAAEASDAVRNEDPPEFIIDPMGGPPGPATHDTAETPAMRPAETPVMRPAEPLVVKPLETPAEPLVLSVPVRVPRTALDRDSKLHIQLEVEVVDE
jgi:signal recognition particle receptor subunit beta